MITDHKRTVKRSRPPDRTKIERPFTSQSKRVSHTETGENRAVTIPVYPQNPQIDNPPTDGHAKIAAALTDAGYFTMHMMCLPTGAHRSNKWWGFPLIIASKAQRRRYNSPAGKTRL